MPVAESRKTLEYHPRVLGLSYTNGDSVFLFSPMRDILGGALGRYPGVLRKRLRWTQQYKRNYEMGREAGNAPYDESLFPWNRGLLEMQDIDVAFREKVKKKETVFTLFDASPGRAIRNMKVKGHVLDAQIKAKKRPGGTTPNYHNANMNSPYLGRNGEMQIRSMLCPCGDYVFDSEKRTSKASLRCLHISLMNNDFASRIWYPDPRRPLDMEGKPAGTDGFVPFSFTPNYVPDGSGSFTPRDPNMAALEYEALVAYYMIGGKGNSQFGIDKRLFQLSEIYTPVMMRAIREGKIKREVLGHKPVIRRKSEQEVVAEENVLLQMAAVLRRYGYRPEGKCLEFGDNVAMRWENESNYNAVNIVFSEHPMCYTWREGANSGRIRPEGAFRGPNDPFFLFGKGTLRNYDDRNMRDTKMRVELPSAMRLPESGDMHIKLKIPDILKKRWKNAITDSSPSQSKGKLKYARLYY